MNRLKRLLIGRPLENEALNHEKYSVFWGLPILASDPISSVAYATEEILLVLVPAIGLMAFQPMSWIAAAIVILLVILTVSYRQTIQNYPNGGGAYIVASDNLGSTAGVVAGAALAMDYILTAAVSISAGTAAITSAIPSLFHYRVEICLGILTLLYIGNLRGIKESAKIFGIPTYFFVLITVIMMVWGIIKIKIFGYIPPFHKPHLTHGVIEPITILLILSAFSSGCAALTGVEAVSNAVPNFKEPTTKHARQVLLLLSFICVLLFGGISILANFYKVIPVEGKTVISQIALEVFGKNIFFYIFQAATMLILALAANTAFADFPMLFSVMSRDGFAPRQMSMRGERLSYSNGITVLTIIAGILIFIFEGDTHRLIPLYAIGVFISFTLSQGGMFIRWLRTKEKGWVHKAIINGTGAVATFVAVIIIGYNKFAHGAWIIVIVIPILMFIMLKIKRHYLAVAEQLRLSPEEISQMDISKDLYRNHVIVPVESVNKASIRALRYAKTISRHVVAFNVATNEEAEKKIREKWDLLNTDIPLVVKYSPYRKVIEPMLEFIDSYEEHSYKKGDMITIILAQFSVRVWWHVFLHNQTRVFINRDLMKHKHIVIATMPLQLKKDNEVLDWHNQAKPRTCNGVNGKLNQ